ncbi:TonB-dependent receptor [Mucilaginibacter myungsuensis]|uniref:TonB-dependent receptor n=1 Tax=Mucilaginibacter myungsuensis TaxID=649104 RepID=A0A929PW97_9SPHI|nr:TonB-dependent receptor [Mucilaginibacter myungsuensis]MBE9661909.1 TonB-dependent receptor [Mucilaginibacter myungsuensis]MDN3599657.1 TonB-dependent receptor [Mucilaginibacter myungsuensis]
MKKLFLITIMLFCGGFIFAQTIPPPVVTPAAPRPATPQRNSNLPPPAAVRTVSGIVKDSTDSTLPGAVVKLVSAKDTLSTSTNVDGIFIFKNVKEATFTLTVSSLGYRTQIKKLLNNDVPTRLTLDPVVLKSESKQLNEVVINGTPSIVYKVDTVEYRASDYKVRPNATLDELLKKMEGMEVASDGSSVTHNGEAITSVKLNGKTYAGGDVKQVITNIPAEILEKVQVVDDYGDMAAKTGVKSGEPRKILNVTTKPDRSIGTNGRLTGQGGNNDRYRGEIYVNRINANQNITLIGNTSRTVNVGTNPGTQRQFSPNISYRDQFGPKVQINTNARYNGNNNQSINQSNGITRTNGNQDTGNGTATFTSSGSQESVSNNGGANFEIEYNIDSANFLQVRPDYSYSTSESFNNSFEDRTTVFQKGNPEHRISSGTNTSKSPSNNIGTSVNFLHTFKKPKRFFSVQGDVSREVSNSDGETNRKLTFYDIFNQPIPLISNPALTDSLIYLLNERNNVRNVLRVSSTYSEPLGQYSQLELNGQVNRRNNNSLSTSNGIVDSLNGTIGLLDRLTNQYDFTTTETRLSLNYRYQGTKVNLSLGTTFVPYTLNGTKLDQNIQQDANTNRSFFRVLPIFRFSYSWSRTQRFTLNYNGSYSDVNFTQIQPFVDRTDINNIVIGNPNLKPSFTNVFSVSYNNYFPNSRFNISYNGDARFYSDQTVSNTYLIVLPGTSAGRRSYNEQYFVNISGARSFGGRYSVSKQLADRRYNLMLNGNLGYDYRIAMNAGERYHVTEWNFGERFGPRINPVDAVEINPFLGTSLRRTYSTLGDGLYSSAVTHSLGLEGSFYFLKTYRVRYDASKNLTTQISNGLPNNNNSPLIINGGVQKEFGAKRQFTVTFDVYDLLKQNNFLRQNLTETGVTNSLVSTDSRYFLLGFRLNLQKWSGSPKRNGQNMQRRGDGSFIYK